MQDHVLIKASQGVPFYVGAAIARKLGRATKCAESEAGVVQSLLQLSRPDTATTNAQTKQRGDIATTALSSILGTRLGGRFYDAIQRFGGTDELIARSSIPTTISPNLRGNIAGYRAHLGPRYGIQPSPNLKQKPKPLTPNLRLRRTIRDATNQYPDNRSMISPRVKRMGAQGGGALVAATIPSAVFEYFGGGPIRQQQRRAMQLNEELMRPSRGAPFGLHLGAFLKDVEYDHPMGPKQEEMLMRALRLQPPEVLEAYLSPKQLDWFQTRAKQSRK